MPAGSVVNVISNIRQVKNELWDEINCITSTHSVLMSVVPLQGSKGDRGARGRRGRVGAGVSEQQSDPVVK